MSLPAALLLLLVAVHFAPEHVAQMLGHSQAAWEGVFYGIESAGLWGTFLAVAWQCRPGTTALGRTRLQDAGSRARDPPFACRQNRWYRSII